MAALARWVLLRYGAVDRRLLGVFRVYFASLLLFDLLRRWPYASLYFSNDGVVPNHFALYSPLNHPYLSLFTAFSSPAEVRVAFALTAACYLALLVGFKTRHFQVIALVLECSLNQRNLFMETGGTISTCILALWSVFLPLGDRYSVDALLARRRLGPAYRPPPDTFVSIAMVGVVLQVTAIYFFNTIHKTGITWKTGESFHYILWQNRVATPLAAWLRLHEPAWLSPLLSYLTLVIEGAVPLLVLSPFAQKQLRTTHVVLITGLHLNIALLMDIGPFSWAMIGLNSLLLPAATVDRCAAFLRPRLLQAAPRLAALVQGPPASPPPEPDAPEPLTSGPAAPEPLTSEPAAPEPPALAAPSAPVAPIALAPTPSAMAREVVAALVLATVLLQISKDNGAVPSWLKSAPPPALRVIMDYTHAFQGWSMFAPDAPRDDGTLVVDGVTADGRHIDPFTGRPPDFDAPFHGPWLYGHLHCNYFLKISMERNKAYRSPFKRYLERWHEIEKRPADRLVSFEVWWVTNAAPRPGSTTPFDVKKSLILSSRLTRSPAALRAPA